MRRRGVGRGPPWLPGGCRQCAAAARPLRRCISVGGWCGPALILGKLGLRTEAFPFDFSRVTLDGVIDIVDRGFGDGYPHYRSSPDTPAAGDAGGFFPPGPPPYKPECVGIWVLYRGRHTAFAHFDLNNAKVLEGFQRKFERWREVVGASAEPVTFFRTVAAHDPREELRLVREFNAAIARINPRLDFRTVVIVHDQGLLAPLEGAAGPGEGARYGQVHVDGVALAPAAATELQPIDARTRLFVLEYTEDASKTLFDRAQEGYATIVALATDESGWGEQKQQQQQQTSPSVLYRRTVIASVDGGAEEFGDAISADVTPGRAVQRSHGRDPQPFVVESQQRNLCVPAAVPLGGTGPSFSAESFPWRRHNNIALINGVASVGGTCAGVGSTSRHAGVPCPHCGDASGRHAAPDPRSARAAGVNDAEHLSRPFTDDEDDVLLLHLYQILTNEAHDRVAAVEQLAHEMNRDAFSVICRLQFLSNSSTKITEGLL